jgi:RNA polymerase sigma factor (sigma-70 family)
MRGAPAVSQGAAKGWAEIFEWLQRDPNDLPAWEALRVHVRHWAQADLWRRGEAAVEEAVADTCARVGIALRTARGAETFGGFVKAQYLAARRDVLKFLGQSPRVLNSNLLPDPPDEGATVEELVVERPYRRQVLQRCLGRLPERERTAIELLYFQESGIAGVAATLGVTRLNARQILWQARTRLRDCLQRLWQTT